MACFAPCVRAILSVLFVASTASASVAASPIHEVLADAPTDLSVTVYRAPGRVAGSFDLDSLEGFALVRETRRVVIPAGESRIRFEGVADGIEPASALIAGLPAQVVEKNRDAHLLSPENLVEAARGRPVILVRSDRKTGRIEHVPGTILSNADGVVFKTAAGVEALRCSGLPETFTFTNITGLSSSPTLSVVVRSVQPMTQAVTLSYLARGFDWGASYTATLSTDEQTIDLGAWVTLANSNGIGFPAAHTQVVAGTLNKESGEIEPIEEGGPVVATCWPMGTTSSDLRLLEIGTTRPFGFEERFFRRSAGEITDMPAALQSVAVTAAQVRQEQLGDLKLYRVPGRTTVASRQSKQVRLLDRTSIPVHCVYGVELGDHVLASPYAEAVAAPLHASIFLRTQNNAANHLGLPLPSGSVALFASSPQGPLLLHESEIRDLATDEEVEIEAGTSDDVQVKAQVDSRVIDPAREVEIPLLPGIVSLRHFELRDARSVVVSNARKSAVAFELLLRLEEGARVVRADHPMQMKHGRPVFNFTVPANGSVTVRYQTARQRVQPVRD